jgi:hypothetical protein
MNTKKIQDDESISNRKRKFQEDESIYIYNETGKKRKIQEDESISKSDQTGKKRKIQDYDYEDEHNCNFVPRKKMKTEKSFENMDDYVKARRDLLIYI